MHWLLSQVVGKKIDGEAILLYFQERDPHRAKKEVKRTCGEWEKKNTLSGTEVARFNLCQLILTEHVPSNQNLTNELKSGAQGHWLNGSNRWLSLR